MWMECLWSMITWGGGWSECRWWAICWGIRGSSKRIGTSTTFMDEFNCDQYVGERINNLYYLFVSRDEWEFAAFLLRSDLTMASIDSLLSLNLVRESFATGTYNYLCSAQVKHLNLSFCTAKRLRGLAKMLPKGPVWQCKVWNTVYPMKKKLTLFYRDPLECIQSILHSPLMKDHIKFKPLRIFESASRAMRIYTEWLSGNAAWSMQVSSLHWSISIYSYIPVERIAWWGNSPWGRSIFRQDQFICDDRQTLIGLVSA